MNRTSRRIHTAAALAAVAIAAFSSDTRQAAAQDARLAAPRTPAEMAKADSGRPPFTAADAHFMQGMIGHHSQAVVMAGWVPSRSTSNDIRVLAERIDVSQRDEIVSMSRWLRERHQTVPDADVRGEHAGMDMPGMTMMPGMLTPQQMTQLQSAKGTEFDKLFLKFMIQHHQGALTMVDQLFGSQGAAQDDTIFKFASDVGADQSSEIDRMLTMLAARGQGSSQ
ncbi:MAG: DUF305 domain-containing protein [Gemmatimonadaceae bacterium]